MLNKLLFNNCQLKRFMQFHLHKILTRENLAHCIRKVLSVIIRSCWTLFYLRERSFSLYMSLKLILPLFPILFFNAALIIVLGRLSLALTNCYFLLYFFIFSRKLFSFFPQDYKFFIITELFIYLVFII